jgi:hypothetical protein
MGATMVVNAVTQSERVFVVSDRTCGQLSITCLALSWLLSEP